MPSWIGSSALLVTQEELFNRLKYRLLLEAWETRAPETPKQQTEQVVPVGRGLFPSHWPGLPRRFPVRATGHARLLLEYRLL